MQIMSSYRGVFLVILLLYFIRGKNALNIKQNQHDDDLATNLGICSPGQYEENGNCSQCLGYGAQCNDRKECCAAKDMECWGTCECKYEYQWSHTEKKCNSTSSDLTLLLLVVVGSLVLVILLVVKLGPKYAYPNKTLLRLLIDRCRGKKTEVTNSPNPSPNTAASAPADVNPPRENGPLDVPVSTPAYIPDLPPKYQDVTDMSISPPPTYSTAIENQELKNI